MFALGCFQVLRGRQQTVRYAPETGHSCADVRFSRVSVRFAPNFGRLGKGRRMSGNNPLRTFLALRWRRAVDTGDRENNDQYDLYQRPWARSVAALSLRWCQLEIVGLNLKTRR